MKLTAIFLLVFWTSLVRGENLRIMTFNTMCSLCDLGAGEEPFSQRIKEIADTVKRQDPDLISFQEFTFRRHVKKVVKLLDGAYVSVYKKTGLYPASDSVLFVRKDRFEILGSDGVWLGKRLPKFSFGWQFGIPRRFQWVVLRDLKTNLHFVFSGSHFDNAFKNKNKSAAYVQNFFQSQTLPVIFASDTNLQLDYEGYKTLLGETMVNTFDLSPEETKVTQNSEVSEVDLCHDHVGGDIWPKCRIDHILISKNSPWKVKSWGEDLFKYYRGVKFVSDHRAVVVDLE